MRKLALALVLLVAAVGCSDATGPDEASITGTYALQTVGGDPLPAVVAQSGSDKAEVTDGAITLNADETFSFDLTVRVTQDGSTTTQTSGGSGTYTRNNNALVFNYSDGSEDSASIDGSTLTLTSGGVVFVFEK